MRDYYRSDAKLSEDGRYRWLLRREWEPTSAATRVTFIMLNPSTADAEIDDPTIRRCVGYANRWGFQGLYVVNLFGLRATNPQALYKEADPIGRENDDEIMSAVVNANLVVCAWGNHGRLMNRGDYLARVMTRLHPLHVLDIGLTGQPKHPLYLRGDLEPTPWIIA